LFKLLLITLFLLPIPAISDTAFSLGRVELLDGSDNGEVVSLSRWRQAVFELRQSEQLDDTWPAPRAVAEKALSRVSRDVIPLALLHARYERQITDGSSKQEIAFAFAPLRNVNYFPQQSTFEISPVNLLQHGDVQHIETMEFDAGDGLGYRLIEWNQPIPVSYPSGGIVQLGLRVTLEDGAMMRSTSTLEVLEGPSPPPPTSTWEITATQNYMGMAGSGRAYLYLAEGRTQITNPVVVVEGFDIDNSIDWPVLYELLNRENLLEDLRSMGYDAVVLDFTEAVEPIQRNAYVLTRLIELILAEIEPDQDMAVIGASMGGLVSRYGLLWMEDQAIEHRVRNFISFDSPHGGANIPLGLQHWLSFFSEQSEDAGFFLSRLFSDAARQMLLYHLSSTSGTTAAPDPLLASFNADLASLGNWPVDPRLSTVINGSGNMENQGFDAGDQIIEWRYRGLLVDIDGDVWSVPDGGSQVIFDGLIDIILLPQETETLTISGTLPWDSAPGGNRATMDQLAEPEAPYGDIIALHGAHSFIPSVSGLALASNDPFYDVAGDPVLLENIPFDQAYFPSENQEHILITPENKNWFITEINLGAPGDVFYINGFESP